MREELKFNGDSSKRSSRKDSLFANVIYEKKPRKNKSILKGKGKEAKNSAFLVKSPKKASRKVEIQKPLLKDKKNLGMQRVPVKDFASMNDSTDKPDDFSRKAISDNVQLFMIDNLDKDNSMTTDKQDDLNASSERHLLTNVRVFS